MTKLYKNWYVIDIGTNEDVQDTVINWCMEQGACGAEQNDSGVKVYFAESDWNTDKNDLFTHYLGNLISLDLLSSLPNISISKITEENWSENWKDHFPPKEIGNRLLLVPPWEKRLNIKGRIKIVLEPGMAFGTGVHPSTELALILLEKYIAPKATAWDIGTGTGVLAIAAIKLGAQSAYVIDNDEIAVEAARKNALINQVQDKISCKLHKLENVERKTFSLITANLFRRLLVENSERITGSLQEEGILIVSGLEGDDRISVEKAYLEQGLTLLDSIEKEGWTSMAFSRRLSA